MATLRLPGTFDVALRESLQMSLKHFFVLHVVLQWLGVATKALSEGYASRAAMMLEDVRSK